MAASDTTAVRPEAAATASHGIGRRARRGRPGRRLHDRLGHLPAAGDAGGDRVDLDPGLAGRDRWRRWRSPACSPGWAARRRRRRACRATSQAGLGRFFGVQTAVAYWASNWIGTVAVALAVAGAIGFLVPGAGRARGRAWLLTLAVDLAGGGRRLDRSARRRAGRGPDPGDRPPAGDCSPRPSAGSPSSPTSSSRRGTRRDLSAGAAVGRLGAHRLLGLPGRRVRGGRGRRRARSGAQRPARHPAGRRRPWRCSTSPPPPC